jgi:hypothetical protein
VAVWRMDGQDLPPSLPGCGEKINPFAGTWTEIANAVGPRQGRDMQKDARAAVRGCHRSPVHGGRSDTSEVPNYIVLNVLRSNMPDSPSPGTAAEMYNPASGSQQRLLALGCGKERLL